MKTFTTTAEIGEDRELTIKLPPDAPVGAVEVTVVVTPAEPARYRTLGDLLRSGFFGSWADRDDITDSVEYAQELRRRAWRTESITHESDR